jgi:hypothetical protein
LKDKTGLETVGKIRRGSRSNMLRLGLLDRQHRPHSDRRETRTSDTGFLAPWLHDEPFVLLVVSCG